MNPKVDDLLKKTKPWHDELKDLQRLVLDCGLTEELKWGWPCYTTEDDGNVVLIHAFRDYCALLFFKGALMKDPKGILIQQTENVQAARQLRFTSLAEIEKQERVVKAYIKEAIAVEKAGLKVEYRKKPDAVPEEFQNRLEKMPALKKAFEALTPGRQRAYLLHFSGAKQSKTREARIEKHLPRILKGKGLDD